MAVVYTSRYDVLATNATYRDIFLVPQTVRIGVPNVLWTLFTVPKDVCPVVHRERELPRMVATLRSSYGRHVGEPAWEDFIRALSRASTDFARMWASGVVARPGPRVKSFRHEAVGEVRMRSQSLSIDGMPEARIVVYTPEDGQTREKVALLRERRLRLWAVTDEAATGIIREWDKENPAP